MMIQVPNISYPIWAARIAMALAPIVLAGITALYLSFVPQGEFTSVQSQTNGNRDRAQQNQTASVNELTDLQGGRLGESKFFVEFDVYGDDKLKLEIDALHNVSGLPAPAPEPNAASSPTSTPAVAGLTRVLRIELNVRSVAVHRGDVVNLRPIIYDHQGIVDDSLADSVNLTWEDGDAGGSFEKDGYGVWYTAPEGPAEFTVSATVDADQCFGDENQCRAEIQFKVRRFTPEPYFSLLDPILSVIQGRDGTIYEVLTPQEGGTYTGDGFRFSAPPGAVENGEFIGINVRKDDAASNGGQTRFGYALANERYTIAVVDASGEPIEAYLLKTAAQICIPTPPKLRDYLSEISMVSVSDAGLTVLSSSVRISSAGHSYLCGELTVLPSRIAAAKPGAPQPPVTGGSAATLGAVMILIVIGAVGVAGGVSLAASRRRRLTPR